MAEAKRLTSISRPMQSPPTLRDHARHCRRARPDRAAPAVMQAEYLHAIGSAQRVTGLGADVFHLRLQPASVVTAIGKPALI
jgi:hypothetical protein